MSQATEVVTCWTVQGSAMRVDAWVDFIIHVTDATLHNAPMSIDKNQPAADGPYLELWLWEYTDAAGQRRRTTYRLTEADARARLRDPVRLEHSLERRQATGSTSDFLKRSP